MMSIKNLREAYGWTQFDLAMKLGVTPGTVAKWESGSYVPNTHQRRRLAEVFGVRQETIAFGEKIAGRSVRDLTSGT